MTLSRAAVLDEMESPRRVLSIPRRLASEVLTLQDGRQVCAVGSEIDLEDEFAMRLAPAIAQRWAVNECDPETAAEIANIAYTLARALCVRRLAGPPEREVRR